MEKLSNDGNSKNTSIINGPLVSIIVITYNSSKYILETLESIKSQTYKNIELIVSDDCSNDDTFILCANWVEVNRSIFKKTSLISAKENSGIAPNCNRGISVANGEWVKLIAGDDLLLPECIETLVKFVLADQRCEIVFGRVKFLDGKKVWDDKSNPFFTLQQKDQLVKIVTGSGIKAPASFIKHSLLTKVNGFDEDYKMIEDVPLWLKISKSGTLFYCVDSFIVLYRLHDSNISMDRKNYINIRFYNDQKKLIKNLIIPELWKLNKYWTIINLKNTLIVNDLIIALGNKNTYVSKLISLFIVRKTLDNAIKMANKFKI